MKIEINDTVKFKLKPAIIELKGLEDTGIVKKKGNIFYEVDCNGYILLVKPSEILSKVT